MSGKKAHKRSRKASPEQVRAVRLAASRMETDAAATAAPGCGCENGDIAYADLTDEERDALKKVDFSVLGRELMEVSILDGDSLRLLPEDQRYAYVADLENTLRFYVQQYSDVAAELANAMELILNRRSERYGTTSQRSSALLGSQGGTPPQGAAAGGKGPETGEGAAHGEAENPAGGGGAGGAGPSGESRGGGAGADERGSGDEDGSRTAEAKGKPRRTAGCAQKVYKNAEILHIECTIPESKLDTLFGEGGWKEMPSADRISTEYSVIPAKIVVKMYHLRAYCAADCTDPDAPGVARAKLPVARPRAKSPIGSGMMADFLYRRNALRIPVDRTCREYCSHGLEITPQRMYENLGYYRTLFRPLVERMWELLLGSRYIQIDETPVLCYDKAGGRKKRGYIWVFTTGEMLADGKPLTLFYFAQGRGADVLRTCLRDFEGVIGSDGHSAYHVFARESGGRVTNAGCLDHFRKRVVAAVRAIPGLKEMPEEERLKIPAYVIMLRLNEVFMLERRTKDLDTKEERDAYRDGPVRDAFNRLVETTLGTDTSKCPAGSYTCKAIRYMENQEIYLEQFLNDGSIASNNSKCERKFAFFAILRNQIKMFGSLKGAEIAADLETIEQTAREYIPNTRTYYQFLIDELCPFVKERGFEGDHLYMEELDRFMPWSEEYKKYHAAVLEREKVLIPLAANF